MDSPYLSFPELPDGYVWTYDNINRSSDRTHDIDLCRALEGLSAETVETTKYTVQNLQTGTLAAWVTSRGYVRERNNEVDAVTYATEVETMQEGIDLLSARAWLGMTGVPDA